MHAIAVVDETCSLHLEVLCYQEPAMNKTHKQRMLIM